MYYIVHDFDSNEDHELRSIPAVLAFLNANRKNKKKRNLGAKGFKAIMCGNGVFENQFKITKIMGKNAGKPSSKQVNLTPPSETSLPVPPMSDKPLPFKTRRAQKAKKGKAPIKEMLQAEDTNVVMTEPETAPIAELTKGTSDPEGVKSNPVLTPQEKKKKILSPLHKRKMRNGRAAKKLKTFLERRMEAKGAFNLDRVKANLQALDRELVKMSAPDMVHLLARVAKDMNTSIKGVLERLAGSVSDPVQRSQADVPVGDSNEMKEEQEGHWGRSLLNDVLRLPITTDNPNPTTPMAGNYGSVENRVARTLLAATVNQNMTSGQANEVNPNVGPLSTQEIEKHFSGQDADDTLGNLVNLMETTGQFSVSPPTLTASQLVGDDEVKVKEDTQTPRVPPGKDDANVVTEEEEKTFPSPEAETVKSQAAPTAAIFEAQAKFIKDFFETKKNNPIDDKIVHKIVDNILSSDMLDFTTRASQPQPIGFFHGLSESEERQIRNNQHLSSITRDLQDYFRDNSENAIMAFGKDVAEKATKLRGTGPEDEDDDANPTSGTVQEVLGSATENQLDPELMPQIAHELTSFNISQLGENSPEDYYMLRTRMATPMELTGYAPMVREFALNMLVKPRAKAMVENMLIEVAASNQGESSLYVKYLNHLLFFLFKNFMKLPKHELGEIENDISNKYAEFFGVRGEAEDNTITSHIRMIVNEGIQKSLSTEPDVQDQLLQGAGALDFLKEWEKGFTSVVRSTEGQEIEKELVARQRMARSRRRGHVLFDTSGSNNVRKAKYEPFKTPIDPALRRPDLDYKAPVSYTRRTPRIAVRQVGGPKRVQVPVTTMISMGDQRKPLEIPARRPSIPAGTNPDGSARNEEGERDWGPGEAEAWYRNEAAKLDLKKSKERPWRELMNMQALRRRGLSGSGAVQGSGLRRRRGIALYADEGPERQAHKRLRKAFTLSMYNEK